MLLLLISYVSGTKLKNLQCSDVFARHKYLWNKNKLMFIQTPLQCDIISQLRLSYALSAFLHNAAQDKIANNFVCP